MRSLETVEESERRDLAGEPALFDKLRELARGGYAPAPDAAATASGILMRHESAPDLILNPDGSIDLPTGPHARRSPATAEATKEKRIYWRRTFVVVVLTIGVWFLSLAVAAAIIGEMLD